MDLKNNIQKMKDDGFSPKRVLFHLKVNHGSVSEESKAYLKEIYGLNDNDFLSLSGWVPAVKTKTLGKHTLLMCRSCLKDDTTLIDSMSVLINTPVGGVSEDGYFSFEMTNCMGMCALGPNAIIDQQIYNDISNNPLFNQKIQSILEERNKL